MEVDVKSLPPGDPQLIDAIVNLMKCDGIFDQLRRESLADVDTKPAYQNLRHRVDGFVDEYLKGIQWRSDLNKNQLRDSVRRTVNNSEMLTTGVDRVVDQVITPKIHQLFLPKITTFVRNFLGLEEKPTASAFVDNVDPVKAPPSTSVVNDTAGSSGFPNPPCSVVPDVKSVASADVTSELPVKTNKDSSTLVLDSKTVQSVDTESSTAVNHQLAKPPAVEAKTASSKTASAKTSKSESALDKSTKKSDQKSKTTDKVKKVSSKVVDGKSDIKSDGKTTSVDAKKVKIDAVTVVHKKEIASSCETVTTDEKLSDKLHPDEKSSEMDKSTEKAHVPSKTKDSKTRSSKGISARSSSKFVSKSKPINDKLVKGGDQIKDEASDRPKSATDSSAKKTGSKADGKTKFSSDSRFRSLGSKDGQKSKNLVHPSDKKFDDSNAKLSIVSPKSTESISKEKSVSAVPAKVATNTTVDVQQKLVDSKVIVSAADVLLSKVKKTNSKDKPRSENGGDKRMCNDDAKLRSKEDFVNLISSSKSNAEERPEMTQPAKSPSNTPASDGNKRLLERLLSDRSETVQTSTAESPKKEIKSALLAELQKPVCLDSAKSDRDAKAVDGSDEYFTDVSVSSVHTSDLSDYDDYITISSGSDTERKSSTANRVPAFDQGDLNAVVEFLLKTVEEMLENRKEKDSTFGMQSSDSVSSPSSLKPAEMANELLSSANRFVSRDVPDAPKKTTVDVIVSCRANSRNNRTHEKKMGAEKSASAKKTGVPPKKDITPGKLFSEKEDIARKTVTEKEETVCKAVTEKETFNRKTVTGKEAISRKTVVEKESIARKSATEKDATNSKIVVGKVPVVRKAVVDKEAISRKTAVEKESVVKIAVEESKSEVPQRKPEVRHEKGSADKKSVIAKRPVLQNRGVVDKVLTSEQQAASAKRAAIERQIEIDKQIAIQKLRAIEDMIANEKPVAVKDLTACDKSQGELEKQMAFEKKFAIDKKVTVEIKKLATLEKSVDVEKRKIGSDEKPATIREDNASAIKTQAQIKSNKSDDSESTSKKADSKERRRSKRFPQSGLSKEEGPERKRSKSDSTAKGVVEEEKEAADAAKSQPSLDLPPTPSSKPCDRTFEKPRKVKSSDGQQGHTHTSDSATVVPVVPFKKRKLDTKVPVPVVTVKCEPSDYEAEKTGPESEIESSDQEHGRRGSTRQRRLNPRYASDDFSSIFNQGKDRYTDIFYEVPCARVASGAAAAAADSASSGSIRSRGRRSTGGHSNTTDETESHRGRSPISDASDIGEAGAKPVTVTSCRKRRSCSQPDNIGDLNSDADVTQRPKEPADDLVSRVNMDNTETHSTAKQSISVSKSKSCKNVDAKLEDCSSKPLRRDSKANCASKVTSVVTKRADDMSSPPPPPPPSSTTSSSSNDVPAESIGRRGRRSSSDSTNKSLRSSVDAKLEAESSAESSPPHSAGQKRRGSAASLDSSVPAPSPSQPQRSTSAKSRSQRQESQRYESSDLYKPRLAFSSSRRSRGVSSPPPPMPVEKTTTVTTKRRRSNPDVDEPAGKPQSIGKPRGRPSRQSLDTVKSKSASEDKLLTAVTSSTTYNVKRRCRV